MEEPKCKQYTIQVNLPEEDALRLAKKVSACGLSVGRLIENFVADLVNGIHSNGSDERMYADMCFERCGFGTFSDMTFLRYLIENGILDYVLTLWEEIPLVKRDIDYYVQHPDETPPMDIDDLEFYLENAKKDINFYWNHYKKKANGSNGSFDEEMKKDLVKLLD